MQKIRLKNYVQTNGEWDNGKCKIEDNKDETDFEDELFEDEKDTKKYKKYVNQILIN